MEGDGIQLTLDFPSPVLALLTPDEIWESAATLVPHLREDRRIERKPPRFDARALGDYFSMWANTSPDGGLVVVGIGDDGELLGFHNLDLNHVNTLEAAGHIYCSDARFVSKRLPVVNSKGLDDFILLFRVYSHKSKVVKTASPK